jgi:cytochrome c553
MTKLNAWAAVAAVCLYAGPTFAAPGNADDGRKKAATCMGCHGSPGLKNAYPGYKVPKLGGQHPEYIAAALKAYKDGQRSHPTMKAQAADLTDQDMANIAAYFAGMGKTQAAR